MFIKYNIYYIYITMAYTGIMTTEAEIDQKMGAGASTSFTDVMKTAATAQAESIVNVVTRTNYSDTFAGLNTDKKMILSDIVSALVAIEGIAYDFTGYPSRIVAEDKINILRDSTLRNLSLIRDYKQQDFINEA